MVERQITFEFAALFHLPKRAVKRGGNFKINLLMNQMVSFLFWLYYRRLRPLEWKVNLVVYVNGLLKNKMALFSLEKHSKAFLLKEKYFSWFKKHFQSRKGLNETFIKNESLKADATQSTLTSFYEMFILRCRIMLTVWHCIGKEFLWKGHTLNFHVFTSWVKLGC